MSTDTMLRRSSRGQRSASVTFVPPPYGIRQTRWRAASATIARTCASLSGETTRSGTRATRPYLIAHISSCVWPWPWRRRTRGSLSIWSARSAPARSASNAAFTTRSGIGVG